MYRKCGKRDVEMKTEPVEPDPVPSTSKEIAQAAPQRPYEDYPKRTPNASNEKVPKWFKPL